MTILLRHFLFPGFAGRRDAAFTLIELLVVLIIVGVLMAIAVPAYLAQSQHRQQILKQQQQQTPSTKTHPHGFQQAG